MTIQDKNCCAVARRKVIIASMGYIVLLFTVSLSALGEDQTGSPVPEIRWTDGPAQVSLGEIAQLQLPVGFRFTDRQGAIEVMRLTRNVPSAPVRKWGW